MLQPRGPNSASVTGENSLQRPWEHPPVCGLSILQLPGPLRVSEVSQSRGMCPFRLTTRRGTAPAPMFPTRKLGFREVQLPVRGHTDLEKEQQDLNTGLLDPKAWSSLSRSAAQQHRGTKGWEVGS